MNSVVNISLNKSQIKTPIGTALYHHDAAINASEGQTPLVTNGEAQSPGPKTPPRPSSSAWETLSAT